MTTISWDDVGKRFYENGVSRGVFYDEDSVGFPWNGLISVEESSVDSTDALYFDGLKYGDLVTLGDFEGKLKAFTYPDQFLPYEGVAKVENGVFLTSQIKIRFGLSWRTEINNDLGQSIGYKIHILYNLLAIPAQRIYETLALDNDPIDFEWDISAFPEEVDNFRPTAYMVIDSRKIDPLLLLDIEAILYGDDDEDASLPNMNGFLSFIMHWARFVVTDNGDGTWTATTPIEGVITMLDPVTFEITVDSAVYVDVDTYEISTSEEEEVP